ncbi:MAG TPA: metal-dependent hydrolase, partial [Gemmatimonadales bacterium]|nr:metal-dependent hydrolase [Gemmatimonadales bacterium]
MASAPTHIVATTAIAAFFHRPRVPWHLWFFGALLAVAPDLDVFAPRVGVAYRELVAHRGLSHSLLTAAVVSGLVVMLFYRSGAGPLRTKGVWLFLFLAMASHGVLDALTKGGLGVAFFAPFEAKRYFFSYRPLAVSPLSIQAFLTSRGLAILINEMRWVWAPSVGLAATVLMLRSWLRPRRVTAKPRPTVKPRPAPRPPAPPPPPPPPPSFAPAPPAPPEPLEPEPATPQPASQPVSTALRPVVLLLQATLASLVRHRGRLVLIGAAVVVLGVGVFVALQQVPPPPVVEQPPAPVAPPPRPLQADAEGYYEPGYRFTVGRFRFTSFTLRPEALVTFTEAGTRAKRVVECIEAVVRADVVRLRCEDPRVAFLTIEGTFPRRVATEQLDAPVVSAVVTVRSATGEVVYRARDSFT